MVLFSNITIFLKCQTVKPSALLIYILLLSSLYLLSALLLLFKCSSTSSGDGFPTTAELQGSSTEKTAHAVFISEETATILQRMKAFETRAWAETEYRWMTVPRLRESLFQDIGRACSDIFWGVIR